MRRHQRVAIYESYTRCLYSGRTATAVPGVTPAADAGDDAAVIDADAARWRSRRSRVRR